MILRLARPHLTTLEPYDPEGDAAGIDAAGMHAAGSAGSLVLLDSNENAIPPSPRAIEAIAHAAVQAHRYPGREALELRTRIGEGLGLSPDWVALGNGADELIDLLMQLFIAPGEEIVLCQPTFLMYTLAARKAGATITAVPARNLEHDLDAMARAVGPDTKLVVVVNPNNPTGTLAREPELRSFLERIPRSVLVVYDEAYHEYVEAPDAPRAMNYLDGEAPFVILRTFSKAHGLAGLRLGYALARPAIIRLLEGMRAPFNVNRLALAAARATLEDDEHVERSRRLVREGKAFLVPGLAAFGVRTVESHTNFVCADLGRPAGPVCRSLAERGVRIRDLSALGAGPSWVRITIGTRSENEALLAALGPILSRP